MRIMRIMFRKVNIDINRIKNSDKLVFMYTDIYLDKNKQFPLIEIDTDEIDILNNLGVTRFICISGNWTCEVQIGEGSFFHKYKNVIYHRNFDEDPINDGSLNLYVKDRKNIFNVPNGTHIYL